MLSPPPQAGQLVTTATQDLSGLTVLGCAGRCLALATCQAFDFSASLAQCRLLQSSRTNSLLLAAVQDYHHYLRLGSGRATQHRFTSLSLTLGQRFYINMILRSHLGHAVVLSSSQLLVDLTPPSPDTIGTTQNDTLLAEGCSASYAQRCYQPTPIQNHR